MANVESTQCTTFPQKLSSVCGKQKSGIQFLFQGSNDLLRLLTGFKLILNFIDPVNNSGMITVTDVGSYLC